MSGFPAFFESRHAELSRLAYLMTGEASIADDLAADALTRVRRHWPQVETTDDPAAYARRMVLRLARRRGRLGGHDPGRAVLGALRRLPHRRRACVVLRYTFDLPEREIARAVGLPVGVVRRQTSRGARQLAELLGGTAVPRLDGWEAAR